MLEPTVPRGQREMFGSVNTVLAVAVRDGLDDVAEVTSHYNQSSNSPAGAERDTGLIHVPHSPVVKAVILRLQRAGLRIATCSVAGFCVGWSKKVLVLSRSRISSRPSAMTLSSALSGCFPLPGLSEVRH